MARIRTIKPEFWEDEKLGKLPMPCRLFYIGCWNFADDQGVFRSNLVILKSRIFPYDENLRISEIKKWLNALEEAQMIVPIIYEGESYYVIRTFRNHQILDKRYMKFIIPSEVVKTTLSHSEHIVNTTQEKEGEKEEEYKKESPYGDKKETFVSSHSHDFIKFNEWIKLNAPYCSNTKNFTKQISESEFIKLKEKYSGKQVANIIEQIENRKDLRKKYTNLYRTVLNWAKKEYGE